jgi:hypothetical protein
VSAVPGAARACDPKVTLAGALFCLTAERKRPLLAGKNWGRWKITSPSLGSGEEIDLGRNVFGCSA